MSGWHSLSGYLHFKPGGPFQKLKAKKKLWFVFEESQGQLLCYKNEADAHSSAPIDNLDIKDAAIMLDLEQQNQFIIMCKGKDYIFRAENHESMMIWLLGLQAKQEIYSCFCCTENKTEIYERSESYNQEKLYQRGIIQCVTHSPKNSNKTHCENLNSVPDSGLWKPAYGKKLIRVRSLPPLLEGDLEGPALVMKPNDQRPDFVRSSSKKKKIIPPQIFASKPRSSSFDGDEDESPLDTGDEIQPIVGKGRTGKRNSVTGESIRMVTASLIPSRHNCLKKAVKEVPQRILKSEPSLREQDLEHELIESKCEMAKILNTLTGYQEALSRKDLVILRLDQRVEELELNINHNNTDKKMKEVQEHVRTLQNKNRFLNKEVKRLAISRRQEQMKFTDQYEETKLLESEVESWKKDYVSLIQSCLHFPNNESTEEPKFVFYGTNHHKEKVCELLEEARKINPGLPLFESLMNQQVHVDNYGFKHMHINEDMVVHYICQQLNLHYSMQLESYESRQLQFKYFCQDLDSSADEIWRSKRQMKVLKVLCRKGIPNQFRTKIWCFLIKKRVEDLMIEKGSHYFSNLINIQAECNSAARYRRQIFVDLLRTMPNNVKFSTAGSKGIMDLRDILLAYCVHNPTIGYCQGMNFFAAMCLLFMNTEDAFWSLVAITECYFPEHYFDYNLIGAQADQALLKDVLKETLPKLATHLENNDIDLSTVTLTWFMSIFFDSVPFQTLLRIWDCFFVEGPKVLFRFSLGLLKMHEPQLLQQVDTISVMRHLKCCAKLTYDVDGLVKNAFEKIHPFPKRHMIASKQSHYQSILREHYSSQLRNRQALLLEDDMEEDEEPGEEVDLADSLVEQALSVQSADIYSKGNAWFCYGKQSYTVVFEVKCKEGIMYELPIKFDTRVLCAQAISSEIFLFGTLSCLLYAYDIESQKQLWELRVHDAVLSLNFLSKEKGFTVFAGLADGNLAVIEGVSNKQTNQVDILYVTINSAPVTALLITGNHIWCASANRIFILSALTLDSVSSFMLSKNPYDVVRCMKSSEHGIWVSVKGSSTIELWDPILMTCKMKYDIKTGKYPYPQEDEEHLNMQRITWLLPHRNVLWVGSGDGNLTIYELVQSQKNDNEIDTDIEQSSENDVFISNKTKSESLSSSNWCSTENELQDSQSISDSTDEILDEVILGLKDLQHSFSPVRGSPDGQASSQSLRYSSEFKKELKDGGLTSSTDESFPLLNVLQQNQPKKIPGDRTLPSKDLIISQDVPSVNSDEKTYLYDKVNNSKPCTPEIDAKNTDISKNNCEELNLDLICFDENQSQKNLSTESIKNALNDFSNKGIQEKCLLCKNQQIKTNFSEPAFCSDTMLNEKNQEVLDKQETDLNTDGYNSKDSLNSALNISKSDRTVPQKKDCNALPVVRRLNSDSMINKTKLERNPRIWNHSSKSKNAQSGNHLKKDGDRSKIPVISDLYLEDIRYKMDQEMPTLTKKESGLHDMNLVKTSKRKKENKKRDKSSEAKRSLSQDGYHDKNSILTEHEIKTLSRAKKKFEKSVSTESSDSAKYVYQGSKNSCKPADAVHQPSKQNTSQIGLDLKLKRSDNPAFNRLHSLDQKYEKLKRQGVPVKSEVTNKQDEKTKREKNIKQNKNLCSSISVDSGKSLEKYFADHEAKYRLEFSNYQVGLDLPNASECSERNKDSIGKTLVKPDVPNVNGDNLPCVDSESSQESKSNFSQQSSVEIIDVSDLNLMARLKISDRPIGCLLETMVDDKAQILSFSGFYGDDEPVLRWTQESPDKMWTNEPLQEICPITKIAKPCGYMKNYYQMKRLSSSSRQDSITNQYQSLRKRLSKTF